MPQAEVLPRIRAAELLDEHRQLRVATKALHAALTAPAHAHRGAWKDGVARRLEALASAVAGHFAAEEAAAIFEEIESAAPEHGPDCEALRAEHDDLRVRLTALLDGLGTVDARHALPRAWVAQAQRWLADLEAHEQHENRLLIEVAEPETPAGD